MYTWKLSKYIWPILTFLATNSCGKSNSNLSDQIAQSTSSKSTATQSSEIMTNNYSMALNDDSQLPKCDTSRFNQLVYLISTGTFQVCSNGVWATTAIQQGPSGAPGKDGINYPTEAFKLYSTYRASIFRITVVCKKDGSDDQTAFGTGFRCDSNKVCSNKHVLSCGNGYTIKTVLLQKNYSMDTIMPKDPLYSSDSPTISTHATRDLAKLLIQESIFSKDQPILPIQTTEGNPDTLTPILQLGYPQGMEDLYTEIGFVDNNYIGECYGSLNTCPGLLYDFATSGQSAPGNSGTPIFNILTGKVVGVITAGFSRDEYSNSVAIKAKRFGDF